jgi:hypothetical protein
VEDMVMILPVPSHEDQPAVVTDDWHSKFYV